MNKQLTKPFNLEEFTRSTMTADSSTMTTDHDNDSSTMTVDHDLECDVNQWDGSLIDKVNQRTVPLIDARSSTNRLSNDRSSVYHSSMILRYSFALERTIGNL